MKYEIKNGAVTLDGNTILEEINIEIVDKIKIGIVGKNGAGKTTLLKALIDNSLLEEGVGEDKFQIIKMGNVNIGYLEQITFNNESITMSEELTNVFQDLLKIEKKLEYLSNNMSSDYKLIEEYTNLEDNFKLLGGYNYHKEIEVMINKFGFSESDKSKPLSNFSGGQRTKIALMKLLLSKPSILLLDEPTNHLDIDAVEWLEDYLKKYKQAIIIVSHDRQLLNNIVDVIYDIDYGKTTKYVGNYEHFEKEKKSTYELLLKNYNAQQAEIKRLRAIYERFRFKPTKASMALSKLKQIERMDIIDRPNSIETKTFHTNIDNILKSSQVVIKCEDLTIGYDKPLANITFELERGKKLGIIGKNGTGKSTLLKTLNKLIEPLSGNIIYGNNLNIAYFDQNLSTLDSKKSILENFQNSFSDLSIEECRRALGSFLFKGDDVFKNVEVLSGGEKVRLELCKVFYSKPNLIILDEPTNHMDIVGKEHLEDILLNYKGTLIFVSHDRYFVNKIADSLLIFKDNEVEYYPYSYQDYKEKENIEVINSKPKSITKKKKNNYNINKEIKRLELEIDKIEKKIKELKDSLYNEEVYSDYNKVNEINKTIEELNNKLNELNSKWEELMK